MISRRLDRFIRNGPASQLPSIATMPDLKLHPGEHETYVPWKGALPPRSWHESNAAKRSLNGTWKFRFSPTATEAGGEEFASRDFDDGKWGFISVPSQWAFEGFGKPWYTNIQFPFPLDPPRVPDDNPTGDYRLSFDLGKWPSDKVWVVWLSDSRLS